MSRAIPEVGARLADRYRLEKCAHSLDGVTVWYATDEMLARPVGIYVIPQEHELAEPMVAAAQAAARLEDSRFVRVLDAVHREGNVHLIFERFPQARSLSTMLADDGPMDPTLAQALITDATEGICAAHEAGLAHLRLQPDTVLVTISAQVKIFGLCIESVRHGTTATDPARADTRGLGRVLHAALTARWPEGEAFGLQAAPYENGAICTPRQVRAGVPDELDSIVDRLLNPQPRVGTPLATPGQLTAELRKLRARRVPPSTTGETTGTLGAILAPYPTRDGGWRPSAATRGVQVAVGGMLVIGLGLLGWQIARAIGPGTADDTTPLTGPLSGIKVAAVTAFDPPPDGDGTENGNQTPLAVDAQEKTTWQTGRYPTAIFGRVKEGVGLVLDLGSPQTVRQVKVAFPRPGHSVEVRAANVLATTAPPDLGSYLLVVPPREAAGESETLRFPFPTKTRFLLIWLTKLPKDSSSLFRGGISEVSVSG